MRYESGRRSVRVGNVIKAELADLVRRELDDSRLEAISVTGVEVTDDLRQARVYVSYYGPAEERTEVLGVLEKAAPYLRSLLGRRIRLRRTPELSFTYDDALDRGLRIQALLAEIESGEESGGGESLDVDEGLHRDGDDGNDLDKGDSR